MDSSTRRLHWVLGFPAGQMAVRSSTVMRKSAAVNRPSCDGPGKAGPMISRPSAWACTSFWADTYALSTYCTGGFSNPICACSCSILAAPVSSLS